jgi:hypothetical protein
MLQGRLTGLNLGPGLAALHTTDVHVSQIYDNNTGQQYLRDNGCGPASSLLSGAGLDINILSTAQYAGSLPQDRLSHNRPGAASTIIDVPTVTPLMMIPFLSTVVTNDSHSYATL